MTSQTKTLIFSCVLFSLYVSTSTHAQTYTGDKSDEITAKKCKLARNIISGKAGHADGTPTDKYDLEIAQSDIKIFCDEKRK
jgi:hypothetical protein